MAKFGTRDPNADPTPVERPPAPQPQVTVDMSGQSTAAAAVMAQQTVQMASTQATSQAQASVGLAQTAIDEKIVDSQLDKQEEHWVKAYWRPAMGWLYMAINLMDFIVFPIISMILPVIYKAFGVQLAYTPWQSLSLSNGGMIHIAFGAILGVAAYTRGQEKLAKIGS
jgi:Holin of 3TMs, for gene-transfer release